MACGFTYSSAISGPNGCAFALSQVSSAAYSPTYFSYLAKYLAKEFYEYDAGNPTPDPADFVETVAKVMGEAVSVSLIDAFQLTCAHPFEKWPSCKVSSCSYCNPNNATSIVKVRAAGARASAQGLPGRACECCMHECMHACARHAHSRSQSGAECHVLLPAPALHVLQARAQSVARMVVAAFAEALLEVYTKDPYDKQLAGQAHSLAIAMADATNTVVLKFYEKISHKDYVCKKEEYTDCSRAVAKAIACVLARASFLYESVADPGTPYEYYDVNGTLLESHSSVTANTTLVMAQCSQSFAAAVSDDGVSLDAMHDMCVAKTDTYNCICQADRVPFWNTDGTVTCLDCCENNLPCCPDSYGA